MIELMSFVEKIAFVVEGTKRSDDVQESEAVKGLLALLATAEGWVEEYPPIGETKGRYGHPAYKDWHDRLQDEVKLLTENVSNSPNPKAVDELSAYLADSFGNESRFDYGSGHEAHFLAFLFCLRKLGVLVDTDSQALVLRVFPRYLMLSRRLQQTYRLEPAGSHGVWGLDDFFFLPFVWGSAQLIGHKYIKPKSIHSADVMEGYADAYLYLTAIQNIHRDKSSQASFSEHSPILNDISSMKTWDAVHQGFMRMYRSEVLMKLPVMQHFLFGSIIQAEWASTGFGFPAVGFEAGSSVSQADESWPPSSPLLGT